ncbi:MAG TPA: phosphatidylserine decarboxylase family protein [Gemmatimonadales bacterium]|nr:phosphatidylserine decarboxylase family protein [Gemmatimonadales bacterium]
MRIAPEGWPFIAIAWTLVIVAAMVAVRWGGAWWALTGVMALFAVWVVAFFRDPIRPGPRGERYVLAAAEGKVVHVIEVDEPMYVKERAVRISIFLSVFDVHVNRYPVDGTVELVHYNKGKFLHAADEKASLDNEQSSIGIRGPRGRVLVRQIAGLIARRIVTDARPGASVTQGARLGLIRFGSRTDVFLPLSARPSVKVKPGDRVRVGGSVLAEYP